MNKDLGIRPGVAEVLNSLGDLLLATSTPARARQRYEQALAIATEIGSQLERARALEGIGRCHLRGHQPDEGTSTLRQALEIYQQIGSPFAQRVAAILSRKR